MAPATTIEIPELEELGVGDRKAFKCLTVVNCCCKAGASNSILGGLQSAEICDFLSINSKFRPWNQGVQPLHPTNDLN